MGIYKQRKKINNYSKNKDKIMGYILCVISLILGIGAIFVAPISNVIYAVFGYISYAIFFVLFLFGFGLASNKKYYFNRAYITILCLFLISIFCALQIAFTISDLKEYTTFASYGKYLTELTKNTSVGGVVFGAIVFPFTSVLGIAGGVVIFTILTLVFGGLILDFLLGAKDRQNLRNQQAKRNISFNEENFVDANSSAVAFTPDDDLNLGTVKNSYSSFDDDEEPASSKLKATSFADYDFSKKYETDDNSTSSSFTSNNYVQEENNNSTTKFDFFNSRNANNVNDNVVENKEDSFDTPAIPSARDEARKKLFETVNNNDENDVDEQRTGELSFEEKLKRMREPVKPVFPDVFTNTNLDEGNQNWNNNRDVRDNSRDLNNSRLGGDLSSLNRDRNRFVNEDDDRESNSFGNRDRINNAEDLLGNRDGLNRFGSRDINDRNAESDLEDRGNLRDLGGRGRADNVYGPMAQNENEDLFRKPIKAEQTHFTGPIMPASKYEREKPANFKRDDSYNTPPISLLKVVSDDPSKYGGDYKKNSEILESTLSSFKINAKVVNVVRGPTVTRYEMAMPVGIPVKKVLQYESDLQYHLCASSVRIEAPIPGKNAFGVELPNKPRSTVGFREIVESKEFVASTSPLPVAIGKSITGEVIVKSLDKMVHCLIAGSTGSGKSVFLHSLIISLMYKISPQRLKFIMIDPKRVEFPIYNGMPHLLIPNVITDPDKAINALTWAVKEMTRRYDYLAQYQVQNIQDFNNREEVKSGKEKAMSYLVIVVDELAELMSVAKKEVEEKIRRITQLGRASGIHLVVATQRPSTEIVTGTIKANLPTRIAFTLGNRFDSETILGEPGAEKLLGQGDMLFMPNDAPIPARLQGAFLTTPEIKEVVKFIKENNVGDYDGEMEQFINKNKEGTGDSEGSGNSASDGGAREEDELFKEALKYVVERKKASVSMLQTRFYIGFNRSSRLIAQMENLNYIAPASGSKQRDVYLTMEDYYNLYGNEE